MKLTKSTLNKLIKEELEELQLEEGPEGQVLQVLKTGGGQLGVAISKVLGRYGLNINNWPKLAAAMGQSGAIDLLRGHGGAGEEWKRLRPREG
jgi:hypothetical protein